MCLSPSTQRAGRKTHLNSRFCNVWKREGDVSINFNILKYFVINCDLLYGLKGVVDRLVRRPVNKCSLNVFILDSGCGLPPAPKVLGISN